MPAITQEVLQELARAIVREAGIARSGDDAALIISRIDEANRVLDAMRDHWKLHYDQSKQLGTASGVVLLGLAALVGVYSPDPASPGLVYAAALLLLSALVGSFAGMLHASNVIGEMVSQEATAFRRREEERTEGAKPRKEDERDREASYKAYKRWRGATGVLFALGAACFLWFVSNNALPF